MGEGKGILAPVVRAAGRIAAAATFAASTAGAAAAPPIDFPGAASRALAAEAAATAGAHDLEAARYEARIARGGYLPTLLFEERFVRTNVPAEAFALRMNEERLRASDFADVDNFNRPPPVNDFVGTLSVSQPIFAPRIALGSRMAAREAGARAFDLARRREEVVYRVLSAYLDVLSARESERVAAQGVEDAREHLRVARALERAGAGLASDVLRTQLFLARAESAAVTARNRLALAKKTLARAMGGGRGEEADAGAPLPPFPEPGTAEARIALALANRSDLRASAERVGIAGTGVRLEQSEYLPTVGAGAAYQLDARDGPFSPDNRTWKVGVELRWNLFDGLRREAAVGKARAETERARERHRGAGDDVALQVSRAWLFVQDAESRLAIARSAAEAAEEGLRLVRSRYANQLARTVDLLDAQSAADVARSDLARAGNDLMQARGELEFATGTLLPWALPEAGQTDGKGR